MKKVGVFLVALSFSLPCLGMEFSSDQAQAILAFLSAPEIKKAKESLPAKLRYDTFGEVQAALTDFSSCNISLNGCSRIYYVSQIIQSGELNGPRLLTAKVSVIYDGEGTHSVKVEDVVKVGAENK